MPDVNPVKNFVIDNLGVSESDYELFGGMLTTASSFGIGVATMMAKPNVQMSAGGVGTVSSGSYNSGSNNQTTIKLTETQKNYRANMAKVNDRMNEGRSNSNEFVTYYRVQGGTPPDASWERIKINKNKSISVERNVNISTGNIEHAEYFLKENRPGGEIVAFDVPKWFDNFVKETAIPQRNYKKNPLNQGRTAPKIVDPWTPGNSYEFPSIWSEWFEEYAKNARKIK